MKHDSIQRWTRSFALGIVLGGAIASILSCGENGSSRPEPITLDDAWNRFETGDYAGAAASFRQLRQADPTLTEALHGLGWSYAFEGNLDSAAANFTAALDESPSIVDARAGLSAVLLALGDDAGAVAAATATLEQDPDWSFAHYAGVNADDLHLILAEAYFALGESYFHLVQAQIDLLEPGNDLDPQDPGTWNGESTYSAALLGAIQDLEADVGADMML